MGKTIGETFDLSGKIPLTYAQGMQLYSALQSVYFKIIFSGEIQQSEYDLLGDTYWGNQKFYRAEFVANNADITDTTRTKIHPDNGYFINPESLDYSASPQDGYTDYLTMQSILCHSEDLVMRIGIKSYANSLQALNTAQGDESKLPETLGYDPRKIDMSAVADAIKQADKNNSEDMALVKKDILQLKTAQDLYPKILEMLKQQP